MVNIIVFQNLNKYFGEHHALKNISLKFNRGETTVILGPSGSGKSTLLRCMNLLEVPQSGTMDLEDISIDFNKGPTQKDRLAIRKSTGMVFQSFNLFPHMKVLENVIEGPITVLKKDKQAMRVQGEELLKKVGLASKMTSYPSQLSGGQQQRVAIARALVKNPVMILFDEPFSNIDPALHTQLRLLVKKIHDLYRCTMLFVTHDKTDAFSLADRVLILEQGRMLALGTPQTLMEKGFLE